MLAVMLSEKDVLPYLDEDISLSAINSEEITILAGDKGKIDQFEILFRKKQIASRIVPSNYAFHSAMMEQTP